MHPLHANDRRNTENCLRDIVALSTLPAMWHGADPLRIAENLAAAVFTTIEPLFVYVLLDDPTGTPIAIAQTDRQENSPALARWVGPAIAAWVQAHDPDEQLTLRGPTGEHWEIFARPLGLDGELGVLAAAFCPELPPDEFVNVVLDVAVTQAVTAIHNAHLLNSLRQTAADQQRAVEALRASEERFRAIINQTNAGVAQTDLTGRFELVNDRYCQIVGYTRDELLQKRMQDITHPDDLSRNLDLFQNAVTRGTPFVIEKRYVRRDDSEVWVQNSVSTISGGPGIQGHVVAICVDVTDRKRAEQALRQSEERFRSLVAVITDVPWTVDPEGRFSQPQPAWEAYTGQTWEQHRDFGWTNALHPDDRERVKELWFKARDSRSLYESDGRIWHAASGQWRYFTARATPLLESDGSVREWVGSCTDVHEQKQAEAALRESEAYFRELAQRIPHVIWTNLPDGRVDFVNEVWLNYTGQTIDYVRSDPEAWMAALHPDDRDRAGKIYLEATRCGQGFTVEARFRRASDGTYRWFLNRSVPVRDPAGNIYKFIGTCTDIDDARRARDAAQESAQRLRFMAESMPQKIFTAKPDGAVDHFNQQWMDFSGLTFEQIKDWGWTQLIHPADIETNLRLWKESVCSGAPFCCEHRFRRHDGVFRWHLTRAHALRDRHGTILMWIGSNTDIDDQKRQEEMLETIVQQRTAKLQETIAELESYSYSISHDMRSPLRAMHAYAQVLQEEYSRDIDETGRRYLSRIASSANRLDRLITDVLSVSRISRGQIDLETVNLDRLIEDVLQHYPVLRDIEIEVAWPLGVVWAAESLLTQAVANLLSNAVKFVGVGVIPRIRVWSQAIHASDSPPVSATPGQAAWNDAPLFIRLHVQDNGIGIAPQDQERIFGIFTRVYSEKEYEGTGIGLSIVKKVMQRLGGSVGVQSQLGKGSTFWLQLRKA